jgi:hypothetical protein
VTVPRENDGTGIMYIGGFCGFFWNNSVTTPLTIDNCDASGNVVAYRKSTTNVINVGGFVGRSRGPDSGTGNANTIKNSYALGDVLVISPSTSNIQCEVLVYVSQNTTVTDSFGLGQTKIQTVTF